MRSLGKATILALATLTASAALNCSGESQKPQAGNNVSHAGSVGLELQIAPGINVDSVHYSIVGPNSYSNQGDINVSSSLSISALIGGIPAGSGYTITLTAHDNADGGVNCAGQATFTVTANTTTPVSVHLLCKKSAPTGSIIVNGTINVCPTIDSIGASPSSVNVGGTVSLASTASDSDSVPSPISYAWSGTGFSSTSQNATFTCTTAGMQTITLTVSDGDAACNEAGSIVVNCTTGSGGAGGTGGTGGGAGAGGAAGAGTAGAGGAAGAGTAGAGGAAGAGAAGAGTAGAGTAGAAGAGTAGTGGTGGTGGGTVDAGPTVSTQTILTAASADCYACMQEAGALDPSCDLAAISCETFAAGSAERQNCLATLACVLPAGAAESCVDDPNSNLTPCYCGTVDTTTCSTGAATEAGAYGACKPLIDAGFNGQPASFISTNIANVTYSSGRAMKIAQCAADVGNNVPDPRCISCF